MTAVRPIGAAARSFRVEHDTEHAVAAEGRVEPVERHYLRRVPHLAGLGSAGAQLSTGFAASGKEASPLTMSARDT